MVRGIPEKWRTVVVLERDTWSTIPLRIFVRRASLSSSRRCHAQILVVSIRSSRLIKAPIPGSCGTEEAEQATLRRFFGWLFTNTCHSIYLPFILYDWLFLIIAGSFHFISFHFMRAYLKALVDQFSCLFQLLSPDARLELATHGLTVHCSTD